MQIARNFNDIRAPKPLTYSVKDAFAVSRKKAQKPCTLAQDLTVPIATDMINCAQMRHNVLTQATYIKSGHYSLSQIEQHYGSFEEACCQMKIMNPDNIDDRAMIIENIRDIYRTERKIDKETYKEYGVYDYDELDKKYGFTQLLIDAGLATEVPVEEATPVVPVEADPVEEEPVKVLSPYPVYTVRTEGRPACFKHTYNKTFFGGL